MCEDENCECIAKSMEDMPPKMKIYAEQGIPLMVHEAIQMVHDTPDGYFYIAFSMGSVKLDIQNEENLVEFNRDYATIFNDENGEISIIKLSEISAFVIEPFINREETEEAIIDCEDEDHEEDSS